MFVWAVSANYMKSSWLSVDFQEFFAKHSVPAAERTVQQSLENIRLNTAWLNREAANVREWLQAKSY